jgi:hypothetical protein
MADREGDQSKAAPDCNSWTGRPTDCKHLKDVRPTWLDGESYACEKCGRAFSLYYDEMR